MQKATTISTPSRRSLLGGSAALLAGAALTAMPGAGTAAASPDAELIQGCDAIMQAYNSFHDGRDYEPACRSIEARAEIIAPIPAVSPAGIQAKARVVHALSKVGMAGYAARILAASLAADVLAGGVA
jgi:hypothetical protein